MYASILNKLHVFAPADSTFTVVLLHPLPSIVYLLIVHKYIVKTKAPHLLLNLLPVFLLAGSTPLFSYITSLIYSLVQFVVHGFTILYAFTNYCSSIWLPIRLSQKVCSTQAIPICVIFMILESRPLYIVLRDLIAKVDF